MLIDLGDNTSRWGAPPAAARVLRDAGTLSAYPEPYAETLKAAIAGHYGCDAACVVTGCGSDDVLDSAVRAFGRPAARLSMIAPSFSLIPSLARLNGLECVEVPLTPTLDADLPALAATGAGITYLCSPNNPTGSALSRAAVEAIVGGAKGLVIIDEAYAEFADETFIDLALTRSNVLLVRTFSKAWGLAGLRVGYGIASPAIARDVERARGIFKVSTIAIRAAAAALQHDVGWMREHAALARASRARLERALQRRDIEPLPSLANFVLAPLAGAAGVARNMAACGVRVRAFEDLPRVTRALTQSGGDAIRITVGPAAEMDACLAALDQVLSPGNVTSVACA